MNLRNILNPILTLFILLSGTALPTALNGQADDAPVRPNILFIAVDDLRPETGSYGQPWIQSPNIDKLAAQGIQFNRAYCQVAVCGASRASLLTGLRPTPERFLNYMTRADVDAPGAMTLPEELRRNGYHTISNGKIFHHADDTADRSWSEPPWRPFIGGLDYVDPSSASMISERGRGPVLEFPDVGDIAYPDGQVAEKTLRDLRRMKKSGQPFFIACGFVKPHLPFYAPKKYWDLYERDEIDVADNQYTPLNVPPLLRGSGEIFSYHFRGMEYNSEEWHRACRHGYYACVSFIDAQIGKLLDELDELGMRENTIVILWGDHGWHLGEHNFWGKHNTMHLATRSPLIVSAPGMDVTGQSEALVEFVDIYPSLCELVGIKSINAALQGTSFVPVLGEPGREWKPAVFSKYGAMVAVITDRYNYSEFRDGSRMLYDHESDPDENRNVADDPEYADTVARLSRLLHQQLEASPEASN